MVNYFLCGGDENDNSATCPADFEALISRLSDPSVFNPEKDLEKYWLSEPQKIRVRQIRSNMGLPELEARVFLVLFFLPVLQKKLEANWGCEEVVAIVSRSLPASRETVYRSVLLLERMQILKYDGDRRGGEWRLIPSTTAISELLSQEDFLDQEVSEPVLCKSDYPFAVVSLLSSRSSLVYFETPEEAETEIDLRLLGPSGSTVVTASRIIELFRSRCLSILLIKLSAMNKNLVITISQEELDIFFISGRREFFRHYDSEDPSCECFDDEFLPIIRKSGIGVLIVAFPGKKSMRQSKPKGLVSVFPRDYQKKANKIGRPLSSRAAVGLQGLSPTIQEDFKTRYLDEQITQEEMEEAIEILNPNPPQYDQAPRGASNYFSFKSLNLRGGMTGDQLKDKLLKLLDPKKKGVSRNFIFVGDAGCGKSSLAYALLPKEKISIVKGGGVSSADSYVNGVGARVTQSFRQAILDGKQIVLIDDASSIFYNRSHPNSRKYDAAETDTILGLLESANELMVIVTLNSLDGMDPAALDRFSGNVIHFDKPSQDQCLELIKDLYVNQHPEYKFSTDDYEKLEQLRLKKSNINHRLISNTLNNSDATNFSDFVESLILAIHNSVDPTSSKLIGFRDSA